MTMAQTAPDALDLDGLEKIARAATAGAWSIIRSDPADGFNGWYLLGADGCVELGTLAGGYAGGEHEFNAAHIAAFDPPTVLALIARLRAAEEALKPLVRAGNRWLLCPNKYTKGSGTLISAEDCIRAASVLVKTSPSHDGGGP